MKTLRAILEDINPTIDYENEGSLIDDGIFDSLSILSLVTELESAFDIEISPMDLVPKNFNSELAIWNTVCRLRERQ